MDESIINVFLDHEKIGRRDKTLSMISNCQTPLSMLTHTSSRAASMLRGRAYLHQYEKYGVGCEQIANAILSMEQIRKNYEEVS